MKFAEIPGRLNQLLFPPDPIIINHTISVEGVDQKKTSCYDIDVEVDDNLKVSCVCECLSEHTLNPIVRNTALLSTPVF